jgi:hypothetical protein
VAFGLVRVSVLDPLQVLHARNLTDAMITNPEAGIFCLDLTVPWFVATATSASVSPLFPVVVNIEPDRPGVGSPCEGAELLLSTTKLNGDLANSSFWITFSG